MFAATAVLLAAIPAATAAAPPPKPTTADGWLSCMRGNLPPSVRVEHIRLTSTDAAGGRRVLAGTLYAAREDGRLRAMLHVDAPGDLAGASYLVRETGDGGQETYLYLPALNRVRRIVGSDAAGSLFGTDLSYADVRQLENAFSGAQARLEGGATIDGRAVQRVLVVPRPGQDSRYDAIRVWVDEQTCVALRVDLAAGGKTVKRLTAPASALHRSGGYWYVDLVSIHDLQKGGQTELRVLGVRNGGQLPHSLFDRHTFYLGGGG